MSAFSEKIKIPPKPLNEVSMIYNAVLLDNPLIFFTQTFKMSNDLNDKKRLVLPIYKFPKKFVKENIKIIQDYLQVFEPAKKKSKIDMVYYVHDYCLNNFKYDHSFQDYSFTVLGLVLNNTAVCEGIAKFVKLTFDYLGIKSLVVSGKAKTPETDSKYEPHAWNIIKIDKKTYHLDVTFDMTTTDKENRYDYFNLCDDDIKKDHCITSNVPKCITKGNDYFSTNSLLAKSLTDFSKILADEVRRGKRNIMIKLINLEDTDDIVDKIMEIAQKQNCRGASNTMINYNLSQCVFEISYK